MLTVSITGTLTAEGCPPAHQRKRDCAYGSRKTIQWICRDITERKRMELQLISGERLAAGLESFSAGGCHEGKAAPVAGCKNFVKMMKKEPENTAQNLELS